MKLFKSLPLVAACVTMLLVLPATSFAATATSPKGTAYTNTLHIVSPNHLTLVGPLGIKAECKWTLKGKIENHGAGKTVSGTFEELTITGCTNGYKVTVFGGGTFEIHGSGTVTSSGLNFTLFTPMGFNCTYATNNTDIGTMVSSEKLANQTAGIGTEKRAIPRTGDSALCGTAGELSGTWNVNTPDYLDIDA